MENITKDGDLNLTTTQTANKASAQTQSHHSTGKTIFIVIFSKQHTM